VPRGKNGERLQKWGKDLLDAKNKAAPVESDRETREAVREAIDLEREMCREELPLGGIKGEANELDKGTESRLEMRHLLINSRITAEPPNVRERHESPGLAARTIVGNDVDIRVEGNTDNARVVPKINTDSLPRHGRIR
jgi:hypothetical protein